MRLEALVGMYSALVAVAGAAVMAAAEDVGAYAGGLALIGGAIAGVYGLLRKLSEDRHVSEQYGALIDQLQEDNDRLRAALRECEERHPE